MGYNFIHNGMLRVGDLATADPEEVRRHLTESQRAMVGQRARALYNQAAKERQVDSGRLYGKGGKVMDNCPQPIGTARDQVGKAVSSTFYPAHFQRATRIPRHTHILSREYRNIDARITYPNMAFFGTRRLRTGD